MTTPTDLEAIEVAIEKVNATGKSQRKGGGFFAVDAATAQLELADAVEKAWPALKREIEELRKASRPMPSYYPWRCPNCDRQRVQFFRIPECEKCGWTPPNDEPTREQERDADYAPLGKSELATLRDHLAEVTRERDDLKKQLAIVKSIQRAMHNAGHKSAAAMLNPVFRGEK